MSNEKFYRYYRVSGPEVTGLLSSYGKNEETRNSAIQKMLDDSGAVGFCETSGWGNNVKLVSSLCFPADHEFGTEVTIKRTDYFRGKKVVMVRGKGRTKEARALNEKIAGHIKEANIVLSQALGFQDYIVNHYQVQCSGIGGAIEGQRGVAMLSTYCGKQPGVNDVLLFAIPSKSGCGNQPDIPLSFEEITYGQFYDLADLKSDGSSTSD